MEISEATQQREYCDVFRLRSIHRKMSADVLSKGRQLEQVELFIFIDTMSQSAPTNNRKSKSKLDTAEFASLQLELLEKERLAEVAEISDAITLYSPSQLQARGLALLNLVISSVRTGLGGKTLVELERDSSTGGNIPSHAIRTGDICRLQPLVSGSAKKKDRTEASKSAVEGVISRVRENSITLSLRTDEEIPFAFDTRCWLVKLANEVTFNRMRDTMMHLKDMSSSDLSSLARILLGQMAPSTVPDWLDITFFDDSLNDSQKDAVRFSLSTPEIALIHGPPGTGKTYTLIEIIRQLVSSPNPLSILVAGPSNISVDNLCERLAPTGIPIVRLGHPARLLPSVLAHSLDALTRSSDEGALLRDARDDVDKTLAKISKTRSGRERKEIYTEVKLLRKEVRTREKKCVDEVIRTSKVHLATLHGSGGRELANRNWDVVIIDEASQALEAQTWIPLLSAKKVILAGDHLQLPPTVKSAVKGKTSPLETTLFDRMIEIYKSKHMKMLTIQYRMNDKINDFPSKTLYGGKLTAAPSVANRLLANLDGVAETEDTSLAVVFVDTQGGQFPESTPEGDESALLGDSKRNNGEAAIVKEMISDLIDAGVSAETIAVITPYNAQVALIKGLLSQYPGIEIGSIDGIQGREKDAVILSLVRSNESGIVGFLGEKRRLNVAMTRAKMFLAVIGDGETIRRGGKGGFLEKWINWLEDNAEIRYPDRSM